MTSPRRTRVPRQPTACAWCGVAPDCHGGRWVRGRGWHKWRMPNQAVILRRMQVRRSDPDRWLPMHDPRVRWRKWKT